VVYICREAPSFVQFFLVCGFLGPRVFGLYLFVFVY
jgi:hypothetical protein